MIYDSMENFKVTHTDEYKAYMKALCRLASDYVSRIRVQFAERAFRNYSDPSIRKLVLAYGDEREKLDKYRLSDFCFVSEHGACGNNDRLRDTCLSNADHYGKAIYLLFDIDDDKEGKKNGTGNGD